MIDFISACIGILSLVFLITFIVVSIRYIQDLISFVFITFLGDFFFGSTGAVIVGILSFILFIDRIIDDIKNPPEPEPELELTVEVIKAPFFSFSTPHKCGGCGGDMKEIKSIRTITDFSGELNSYEDTRRENGYEEFIYECKSCGSLGSIKEAYSTSYY